MTDRLYGLYKEHLIDELSTDDIKAVLVDLAYYTPNFSTDEFLSDIPEAARVATSPNLDNKTIALGLFNADNSVFSAVTGDTLECVVLYIDTGSAATSRLICYLDTPTGLPLTPNGADVTLTWDDGDNKIFKL